MGFLFTEHCPNCGKTVAKDAEYCEACGCPTATSWATCHRFQAAIAGDAQFCWKCGAAQDLKARRALYGDRWQRSPSDFAVRVDLAVADKVLRQGIQVDEGTLALLFQEGEFKGTLGPGYHSADALVQGLAGLEKASAAHAILLDAQSAEVDFEIENILVKNQVPISARIRLLFQIRDAKKFADKFLREAASFTTQDLTAVFQPDVAATLEGQLKELSPDDLIVEAQRRQLIEEKMVGALNPTLAAYGLEITGVRLADFGGPAIDFIREKLGEIHRLDREFELNRRLRDAVRAEKVDAFRDEEQLKDYYEQISHELGFKSAEREQERRRFMQVADHNFQLEGLSQDYQRRRAEILNRLDEQRLRHTDEITDVHHQLEISRAKFIEEFEQNRRLFLAGQKQQKMQAVTDRKVGEEGLALLRQTLELKLKTREAAENLALRAEAERLRLRGGASLQALLATLSGEQGDRVLRLAELEMRRGATEEQVLAFILEKAPEIGPAIAEALKTKYGRGQARLETTEMKQLPAN
jgi:hypothetical protein